MRPICLAKLDKTRPVVVLTRPFMVQRMRQVTVAPITSRIRGLTIEVPVGKANGLDCDSVINCDNIVTIDAMNLGRHIGYLNGAQESALQEAIMIAFDLL